MIDILAIFNEQSAKGLGVALMPIKGLVIEGSFNIEGIYFANAESVAGMDEFLSEVDSRSFTPIQAVSDDLYISDLSGDTLRRYTASLTGISKDVFFENTIAIVPAHADWSASEKYNHSEDVNFLLSLSQCAFDALDFIRFQFCRLDLPDTLPGIPGYWQGSDGFFGAAVLTPTGKGRLLCGKRPGAAIVEGLGLELNASQVETISSGDCSKILRSPGKGKEVGVYARKGLKMLSRAMYANNDTLKFLVVMALFEYLGTGDSYSKFEDVRKKLQPHIAKNASAYYRLGDRFQELTSKKVNNTNIGYRHRVVHEGEFLEDLIASADDRKALFRELDRYAGKVIFDMCNHSSCSWDELNEWRRLRTSELLGGGE